ncbi:MAG: hypothetical protein ACRD2B_04215 [Terriglobia bacterium]
MARESESSQQSMWDGIEVQEVVSQPVQPAVKGQPRLESVNRQQVVWRTIDVEQLIEEDHPARAIWELVGKLDLSSFRQAIGAPSLPRSLNHFANPKRTISKARYSDI